MGRESNNWLYRYFHLEDNHTNVKTEVIAGLTTFATMAYIVAVVPAMLAEGGLPRGSTLSVVVLMTVITTTAMALYTNRPFALGPGMGSVAIFSLTLLKGGVPLPVASGIIVLSGLIFMAVSFLGVRDFIVKIIPPSVKIALGAGIGLFISCIGFRQAGIIVADASKNVLSFGNLAQSKVALALIGFLFILFFESRKVKGGIILSIILATIIGIPMGITKIPSSIITIPQSIAPLAFKVDLLGAMKVQYLPFLLAFFIPDFFSTLGTVLGVGALGGFLDEKGNLPGIEKCFHVDSCATTFGGLFSCPVMTTYLESSAGVAAGGRTGLTALVTACAFMVTLFFSPLALMIPSAAAAPALIYIGITMLKSMARIDYDDFTEYFPAFICIVLTIFSFNSGNGVAAALIAYAFLKLVSGRVREVHWSLYIVAFLMVCYFYTLVIH